MDHYDANDEYEEVPSPFQQTKSRPNMFARPLGTIPSEAPIVTSTRRSPARSGGAEFLAPKRRALAAPAVDYLDDDEVMEEVEEEIQERALTRPKPQRKSKARTKTNLLPRIAWAIVALLSLRLLLMERGILQYWHMSGTLQEHAQELARVKKENEDIQGELRRMELDKAYQKQLAKELLGVIAADEFLILFAGESTGPESGTDRPL